MTTADPFRIRFLSDPDVLRLGPGDLLDDERRCLGAAILDNVCLDGPLSGLTREHFSLPAHQELFTLMREWRTAGLRFDLERLRQTLLQHKRLQAVGDYAYLQQLVHHGRQSLGNVIGNVKLLIRKAAANRRLPSENQAPQKTSPTTTDNRELGTENFLMTLAEVEAKPVDWIWEPYLPCGAVAVLSGDPGVGKSFVALAIAARLTAVASEAGGGSRPSAAGSEAGASQEGATPQAASSRQEPPPQPTENREPRTENSACNVLYIGGSDSPAQVLRPRFAALGGEAKRLHLVGTRSRFPLPASSFLQDNEADVSARRQANEKRETGNRKLVPLLAVALQKTRARLVIIDPLESYLAAEGIGPRSQKFRRWLDQLAALAREYHCCVLLVRTLSRSPSGRATAGALGSIELAGAIRSHLVAGVSAGQPEQRAVVQVKANWGPCGPALGYAIDEAGKFGWTGASPLTAEDILAPASDEEQKSSLAEAEHFLQTTLARGAAPAATVQQEARSLGIAGVTLQRAKRRLGVRSKKQGAGPWVWEDPVASGQEAVARGQWPVASKDNQEAVIGSRSSAVGSETAASQDNTKPQAASDQHETLPQPTENREPRTEWAVVSGQ